jgi:hypothetical protein
MDGKRTRPRDPVVGGEAAAVVEDEDLALVDAGLLRRDEQELVPGLGHRRMPVLGDAPVDAPREADGVVAAEAEDEPFPAGGPRAPHGQADRALLPARREAEHEPGQAPAQPPSSSFRVAFSSSRNSK